MGMRNLVCGVLLLAACKSAGTEPAAEGPSGNFEWIRASGGIAGRTMTPSTENYGVRFSFTGNQVSVFRNDSLKGTSTVTVRNNEITYQPSISAFLFHSGIDTQSFRIVPGDTLVLTDPCCDRFEYVFVRR
jgi:hypothetical protein